MIKMCAALGPRQARYTRLPSPTIVRMNPPGRGDLIFTRSRVQTLIPHLAQAVHCTYFLRPSLSVVPQCRRQFYRLCIDQTAGVWLLFVDGLTQ